MYGHIERQTSQAHLLLEGEAIPKGKRTMGMSSVSWVYDEDCRRKASWLRESGFDTYCLFCMTGCEIHLVSELNHLNRECIALPFLRMKRRSEAGKSILVQEALLKGYVFLFVPAGYDLASLQRGETAFRILDRRDNGGLLEGEDRKYAEWVLSCRGILDISQAIQINDRIKIISGPLLDLQGCVTGLSKRNKNYRVQFEMMGRSIDVWLPFELMEPAGEWRGQETMDDG